MTLLKLVSNQNSYSTRHVGNVRLYILYACCRIIRISIIFRPCISGRDSCCENDYVGTVPGHEPLNLCPMTMDAGAP